MNIGDSVRVVDDNSPLNNKTGVIEDIKDDVYTVMIDFIPSQHKKIRQDFEISQLEAFRDTIDDDVAFNTSDEIMKLGEAENSVKIDSVDLNTKKKMLSEYFNTDCDDVYSVDDNTFQIDDGTYIVCNNDYAKDFAYKLLKDSIESNGLYYVFYPDFLKWIVMDAVNEDALKDICNKEIEDYYYTLDDGDIVKIAYDIFDDNDLNEVDSYENGYEIVDYYRDKLVEHEMDKIDSFSDYLLTNFDIEEVIDYLEDESEYEDDSDFIVFDMDKIIKEAIRKYGISYFINGFDCDAVELSKDLYLYKVN